MTGIRQFYPWIVLLHLSGTGFWIFCHLKFFYFLHLSIYFSGLFLINNFKLKWLPCINNSIHYYNYYYLLGHIGFLLTHSVEQQIEIFNAWTLLCPLYTALWCCPGRLIGRTVPLTKPKQLSKGEPLAEITSAYCCKWLGSIIWLFHWVSLWPCLS